MFAQTFTATTKLCEQLDSILYDKSFVGAWQDLSVWWLCLPSIYFIKRFLVPDDTQKSILFRSHRRASPRLDRAIPISTVCSLTTHIYHIIFKSIFPPLFPWPSEKLLSGTRLFAFKLLLRRCELEENSIFWTESIFSGIISREKSMIGSVCLKVFQTVVLTLFFSLPSHFRYVKLTELPHSLQHVTQEKKHIPGAGEYQHLPASGGSN